MEKLKKVYNILLQNNKIIYYVICFIIITIANIVFLDYATVNEIWFDEVASIGFVNSHNNLSDTLNDFLTFEVTNLPIF